MQIDVIDEVDDEEGEVLIVHENDDVELYEYLHFNEIHDEQQVQIVNMLHIIDDEVELDENDDGIDEHDLKQIYLEKMYIIHDDDEVLHLDVLHVEVKVHDEVVYDEDDEQLIHGVVGVEMLHLLLHAEVDDDDDVMQHREHDELL